MTESINRHSLWANRFEIRRRLGAGGLGEVYEAFDREHQELVALKTLRNLSPEALYSFKQEFRSLAEIRHPNLVRLGELFSHDRRWFFSMELLRGVDFIEYVRPGHTTASLDLERLRRALTQLVQGLTALHNIGLIHRDIKPSNLLVTDDDRLVLLDFGLVARHREALSIDGNHSDSDGDALVGTALYMSPEQAQSLSVGPASDWYSVGVLLYQALSGHFPFSGNAIHVVYRKVVADAPPLEPIPDGAHDLATWAMDLVRRAPEQRPDGADLARFFGIKASEVIAEVGPQAPERSQTPSEEFVGRTEELAQLESALETARSAPDQAALIVGEAGVGKSLLARRFLFGTNRDDLLVLPGRCYRRESVPYNGLDGIIDALTTHLRRLPDAARQAILPPSIGLACRLFPVLAGVSPAVADAIDEAQPQDLELRERAFDALRDLFGALARRQALCLFIDDLQWADDETLALLSHLTSHWPPRGLMILGTVRRGDDGTFGPRGQAGLKALAKSVGDPEILRLSNLNDDETRHLIRALWPDEQTPRLRLIDRLVTETRGHPLMLTELVRHVFAQGLTSPGQGIRLAQVIQARVHQLAPLARHILEIASVSGLPLATPLIETITARPRADVHQALDHLQLARLVRLDRPRDTDLVSLYHGRIRDALVDEMDASARRSLHAALADAYLSPTGSLHLDDPLVLVDHLESAARLASAAEYAETAADRAARAFAFARAARLYERALTLGDVDPDHQRRLQIARADMIFNDGRTIEAAQLYLAAADPLPTGQRRRQLRRQAAEAYLINGDVDRGLALLEDVLQDSGLSISTSKTTLIANTLWHHWRLKRQGLAFVPRNPDTLDPDERERLQLLSAASRQVSFLDPLLGFNFRVRTLRAALKCGHRAAIAEGVALEAVAESARNGGNGLRRSDELLDTARQIAVSDAERAIIAGCHASALVFSGRAAQALPILNRSLDLLDRHVLGSQRVSGRNRLLTWKVKILYDLGHFTQLRNLIEDLSAQSRRQGDILRLMALHRMAAMIFAFRGQPQRVAQLLDEFDLYQPLSTASIMHWYDLRTRCELALYQGLDLAEAEQFLSQFHDFRRTPFARRFQLARIEVIWTQARLALATMTRSSETGHLIKLVDSGINALQREADSPLSQIYAQCLQAGRNLYAGRHDRARQCLAPVIANSRSLGLECLHAVARLQHDSLATDPAPEPPDFFETHQLPDPHRIVQTLLPGAKPLLDL